MPMNSQEPIDRLDQATADRLMKLRSMPVDTSRLDHLIEAQIPRARTRSVLFRIGPLRAVAASLATIGMIGVIVWSLSGGAVLASPDMMAQFHRDMLSDKTMAIKVDTIAQANQAISEQWNNGVQIPQVPAEHVMMCCMRSIKDKRVACVLLQSDGVPVTMAVASAMDMKCPTSQTLTREGVEYHIQSSGNLNMVMAERDGRWICLIGTLPADRLMNIAGAIRL